MKEVYYIFSYLFRNVFKEKKLRVSLSIIILLLKNALLRRHFRTLL